MRTERNGIKCLQVCRLRNYETRELFFFFILHMTGDLFTGYFVLTEIKVQFNLAVET